MPPAARVGDMHMCPAHEGHTPHRGGPIQPTGCPDVLIGDQPAARAGDMAACDGAPDTIVQGSPTVLIGNMPAARLGDNTVHGGVVISGFSSVLIDIPARGYASREEAGSNIGGASPQAQRDRVANLIRVEDEARAKKEFQPERPVDGKGGSTLITHCSENAFYVGKALGFPWFLLGDLSGNFVANVQIRNFEEAAQVGVVRQVTPAEAQTLADGGILVFATQPGALGENAQEAHGHIAPVRPDCLPEEVMGESGPVLSNVGKDVGVFRESKAFGNGRPVTYYTAGGILKTDADFAVDSSVEPTSAANLESSSPP